MKDYIVMSSRPGTRSIFGTGIFAVACDNLTFNSKDLFEMTDEENYLCAFCGKIQLASALSIIDLI
jgi:hypothetical protein